MRLFHAIFISILEKNVQLYISMKIINVNSNNTSRMFIQFVKKLKF